MSEPASSARSRRQWEAYAKARISSSTAGSEVETDLIAEGLDPQSAREIVSSAMASLRARATKLLIGSLAFAACGLLVTIGSFSAASSGASGGEYFIWFGPVIAGGIAAVVALMRLLSIRK